MMSDHSMTLGIHEGGFPRLPQVVNGRLTHPQQVHICTHPMEQMISAVSLIYGGVLERCPGLKVAFLEAGCGWVPFWLHRMDEHWENATKKDFGLTGITEKPPSEYFRRQCYVSADSSEYMLAQVIELIGDDKIVFTTDYPHPDSPWPHAVEEFLALPACARREQAQDPVGQLARALRPRRVTGNQALLGTCGRIYRPERAEERRSGQVRSSSVRSTSANRLARIGLRVAAPEQPEGPVGEVAGAPGVAVVLGELGQALEQEAVDLRVARGQHHGSGLDRLRGVSHPSVSGLHGLPSAPGTCFAAIPAWGHDRQFCA